MKYGVVPVNWKEKDDNYYKWKLRLDNVIHYNDKYIRLDKKKVYIKDNRKFIKDCRMKYNLAHSNWAATAVEIIYWFTNQYLKRMSRELN